MNNTIRRLNEQGQSIWCDNISRRMIDSGELQRLIDLGVVGITSNPTIFMKAITGGTDYDALIASLSAEGLDPGSLYEKLVLPDIADAADLLRPVYERTEGVDGYISLEVSPHLAEDTERTISEGLSLFRRLGRPNVFIKVPATPEGIPAVEELIAQGVNVNITLIFDLGPYEQVMEAYRNGIERYAHGGGDVSRVASVASFFVSRIDTAVDNQLEALRDDGADVDGLTGRAAIAVARLAYARYQAFFAPTGPCASLMKKGARRQRILWASTSTKNPNYSPTKYVDGLVGPGSVNTAPPVTIEALLSGGSSNVTIHDDLEGCQRTLEQLASLGIDVDSIMDQLLTDGVRHFSESYDRLLEGIEQKQAQLNPAR